MNHCIVKPICHKPLDKREFLIITFLFLIETICCDTSSKLSRRDDSGEGSPCFYAELTKIIPNYHQILPLI